MGHIVMMDADGHLVYEGLLSSQEKASIDEILNTLKTEIPQVEFELKEKYGNGALYKYYLGKFLGGLLDKYNIIPLERRKFWDEIKNFATKEKRTRDEGKNSARRSFYEQCYQLSQYDIEVVQKLTWKQWQDILDRSGNRDDERIFIWLRNLEGKITAEEWATFEKGLHRFLKNKDTSVFTDDEMFEIYDSILSMGRYWIKSFNQFAKENPNSAKIEKSSKTRRSNKYLDCCFKLKKEYRRPLDKNIFSEAFDMAMK